MTMSLFSLAFLKAAAERAVATAAQSALAVVGVDQLTNAFALDWTALGGVALGGALLSLLKSLAVGAATKTGPSLAGEKLEG